MIKNIINIKKNEVILTLTFNDENNDFFYNEINEIIKYLNLFKDEIKQLKEEIEKLKQKELNSHKIMLKQLQIQKIYNS